LPSKLRELRIDLHEGILGHVPSLILAFEDGESGPECPRLMALDKLAKGALIAIDGERYQRAVFLFFHWELHMSRDTDA
jgi:hypothetical protein